MSEYCYNCHNPINMCNCKESDSESYDDSRIISRLDKIINLLELILKN